MSIITSIPASGTDPCPPFHLQGFHILFLSHNVTIPYRYSTVQLGNFTFVFIMYGTGTVQIYFLRSTLTMHTSNIISTFLLGHFFGSAPAVFRIRIRTGSYGFSRLRKKIPSFMLNFVAYWYLLFTVPEAHSLWFTSVFKCKNWCKCTNGWK